MRPWPDFADVVMDLLTERWDGTPPGMGTRFDESRASLPYLRVNTVPGYADRLEAWPNIDISAFAATYREASDLAFDVEALLMGYPLSVSSGGRVVLVDKVEVISSPTELDVGESSSIRRFLGTYQLRIRRG